MEILRLLPDNVVETVQLCRNVRIFRFESSGDFQVLSGKIEFSVFFEQMRSLLKVQDWIDGGTPPHWDECCSGAADRK
jgi:hypothetical protein